MRLLVALAALTAVAATAWSGTAPKLAIRGTAPLVVRGIGFKPREVVTLVVMYDGRHRKRIQASSSRAFTAKFRFSIEACAKFHVSARGNRGSRASYLSPLPSSREQCGAPPAGP